MYINLFFFHSVNSIGGIETFFYSLGQKYGKDFDITLFYVDGDPKQIKRLSEFIRVKKYHNGQHLRCKRAFVCFNPSILDFIEADEYFQVLHGEYTKLGVYPQQHPKITGYISVSEAVRNAYMQGKGEESVMSYNPFVQKQPKKVLNLVSATRLTSEKGKERIDALADALDTAGVPFTWLVFTDNPNIHFNHPDIIPRPPKENILDYIAKADYLVQLSDAEGYCYSIVEALSVGTPVIATDMTVLSEIGVVNGKNGFIVPMSMEFLPIDDIVKGLKKFKYVPPEDHWGDLLVPGDSGFEKNAPVTVRCKRVFYDIQAAKMRMFDEEWVCTMGRASELENLELVDIKD